jgi:hypothetical protein
MFSRVTSTLLTDTSNAIDLLCSGQVPKSGVERDDFEVNFEEVPDTFTAEEREAWLQKLSEVAVSSDAFFPFADNVYRLARSGAKYVAAPTGSVNDEVSHAIYLSEDKALTDRSPYSMLARNSASRSSSSIFACSTISYVLWTSFRVFWRLSYCIIADYGEILQLRE